MDTWEDLQARLFHLAWLGEELAECVTQPMGAWLFRQISRECDQVAAIAADWVAECERAGLLAVAAEQDSGGVPPGATVRARLVGGDAL